MKISSKIHPQPGQAQLMVLDVIAEGKPFFAALLIGDLRTDPPSCSEVGNECLRRLTAIQDNSSNSNTVVLFDIRSADRAQKRIAELGKMVEKNAAVAIFCLDPASYDAAFKALTFTAKPQD